MAVVMVVVSEWEIRLKQELCGGSGKRDRGLWVGLELEMLADPNPERWVSFFAAGLSDMLSMCRENVPRCPRTYTARERWDSLALATWRAVVEKGSDEEPKSLRSLMFWARKRAALARVDAIMVGMGESGGYLIAQQKQHRAYQIERARENRAKRRLR